MIRVFRRWAPRAPIVCVLAAALVCCCAAVPRSAAAAHQRDPQDAYLRGLRQRRLFSLAERHCLRRLARTDLSLSERTQLTVELSRCFAEHATYRTGREQSELWERARTVVEQLLHDDPANPDRARLELQAACVLSDEGEWLRWQSELAPHDENLRSRAIERLQHAVDALRAFESALHEGTRSRAAGSRNAGDAARFGAAELRKLGDEANFRTGVANLDLARLLPPGLDRTAALKDAESRLHEIARTGEAGRAWTARLLRATVARIRGDHDEALRRLEALAGPGVPVEFRRQAAAEAARIELARGRFDAALQRIEAGQQLAPEPSPELQCVDVEARLAASEEAAAQGNSERAADLLAEAERLDAQIEGPWRARSHALLQLARQAFEYGPEVGALVLAARAAHQQGNVPSALEKYGQAVERARAAERTGLAGELLVTRGSLLLQAESWEEAAADLLTATGHLQDAARIAQAHLLYAYARGKMWEARPTQSNRQAYEAALEDHRARFADQPTQVEALWMLAAYHEARLQWTDALELYRAIPVDHARAPAARVRIAVLHQRILDRLQATGQPRDEWEDRAVEELSGFVSRMPSPPAALSRQDAEVVLAFARIVLAHRTPRYGDADSLLDRVIESSRTASRQAELAGSTPDPDWKPLQQSAEQLRIVSLAGQGRLDDAQQLLGVLSEADPQSVLEVLDGLCEIAATVRAEQRGPLAQLQLDAAEDLARRSGELDEHGQQLLDKCLAQAYGAAGRPNDAVRAYRRMLERSPNDAELLAEAARGFAVIGRPESLREAKSLWRRVETLHQPGSTEWLAARLEVARLCSRLGEHEECRKLLRVTRLLYPELGGDELRSQYEALEKSLESDAP